MCTHPEAERKLIFVNCYFTSHIKGLDPDENIELIKHLAGLASIVGVRPN